MHTYTLKLLKEAMRLAYLWGVNDTDNDVQQICEKGSAERIEELISEGLIVEAGLPKEN